MRLLFLLCLVTSPTVAGELADRFEHQQVIEAGFQDNNWRKLRPKREQSKVEIGFEKAFSCRRCPAYLLIVDSDGHFTFEGFYKTPVSGIVKGTIPKEKVKKIISYINEIDFFSFRNRYYPRLMRTHVSRNYTYAKLGDKYKVIQNVWNVAPASVWGLELMLDSFVKKHVFRQSVRVDSYS